VRSSGLASHRNGSRCSGAAIDTMASTRSRIVSPRSRAMLCSVAITSTSPRAVVTGPWSRLAIFERPSFPVEAAR